LREVTSFDWGFGDFMEEHVFIPDVFDGNHKDLDIYSLAAGMESYAIYTNLGVPMYLMGLSILGIAICKLIRSLLSCCYKNEPFIIALLRPVTYF